MSVFSVISDVSFMFTAHDCEKNIFSRRRNRFVSGGSIDNCGVNNVLCRNKHA